MKTKLIQNERVFFEPQSHTYLLDGSEVLIGVTELMKKHGLSADYSGVPEATLRKAAEEGTKIHQEIEEYENGAAVLISPLIQQYQKLGLKCIQTEYLVSDNLSVASSIDGVYSGSNIRGVILVDYKTTQKLHRRALEWQLGIYRVLFEMQNPGLKVESCYCLHIDKKKREIIGLIPITPVTDDEVQQLLSADSRGEIYIDQEETPEAALVLSDEEISDVVAKAAKVDELKAAVKEIEAALKGYYDKVRDYMLANNLEELATDGGKFKLKKAYETTRIDTEAVKRYAPELYTKCSKTTTVAASVSFKKS